MAEPWFRMHANPTKLKVTARFMEYTKIDKTRAVGYLATFWGAISQHCPGGVIADIPDSLIEEWAEWKGKRGVFASFVRLFHSKDGKVNDYDEYSGKLEERKARDRARKIAAQSPRKDDGTPQEIPQTSDGIPEELRTDSSATIRYETIRNKLPTKHPRASAPWMGKVIEVWHEIYPSGDPPKGTAKILAPLFAKQPEQEVCDWLRQYLTVTDPQFLNLAKAASTYAGPGPKYINGSDDAAVMKVLGMIP